ncbi:MAG: alpha/beta hydrolase [Tepidisphaerales bacterium]
MPLVATTLMFVYALLPLGAWAFALRRWQRHGQVGPAGSLLVTCVIATLAGIGVVLLNTWLLEGHVSTSDAARTIHVCVAAACAIKIADWWSMGRVCRWLGVGREQARRGRGMLLLAFLLQRAFMLTVTLGYVIALLLVYRPKVTDGTTPTARKLAWHQERFTSADGVSLSGWFLPAPGKPADNGGATTVLICHGVGSRKQQQLGLAEFLVGQGYNVMLFDFRAHGASGGNAFSYGVRERLDVLAAARQVRQRYPDRARRIVGLGMNTGAAALVMAAADREGDLIDGLVVVEPWAGFDGMATEVSRQLLPAGLRQVARWVSLPLASCHAGAWLGSWDLAASADALWPRPVLVIHGRGQTFVAPMQEMQLYQWLPGPRDEFWPSDNYQISRTRVKSVRNDADLVKLLFRQWMGLVDPTTGDAGARARIIEFLHDARPQSVI